jgi:hypothetical protein
LTAKIVENLTSIQEKGMYETVKAII